MSKANKKIRDATLGGVNWWDYLTSIRPKGHRNEPQYLDYGDVKNKKELVTIANKLIKERKREDRTRVNLQKHCASLLDIIRNKRKHHKKSTKTDQIQYGFDLANWWNEQHEV